MALLPRRHRILTPANGIHGIVAWDVESLDDIAGPFVTTDMHKVARVATIVGEEDPTYQYFVLSGLDGEGGAYWRELGGSSYALPKWTVADYTERNDLVVTIDDLHGIVNVTSDHSYWILADVSEGAFWKQLDNASESIVYWTIDPEGYPDSLAAIGPMPEDLHRVAFVPSGGDAAKYFILADIVSDGMGGYDATWRPLDAPAVDISGKADKQLTKVSVSGTTRTITAADFDSFISSSNAALQTFTLNALTDTPVRSLIVMQYGTGKVRFAAGAGATIRPTGTIETSGQYSVATLALIGANEWLVTGDVTVT